MTAAAALAMDRGAVTSSITVSSRACCLRFRSVWTATGEARTWRSWRLIRGMPLTASSSCWRHAIADLARRQRLRLGVAHLPGDPPEPDLPQLGLKYWSLRSVQARAVERRSQRPASSRRSASVFLGRPSKPLRQDAQESIAGRSRAMFMLAGLVLLIGIVPATIIDALARS